MASSEQLRFVPDTLPVVAQEKSPAANDEQPVAGEAVHARGEMSPEEPKEPITIVKKKVEEVISMTAEPDLRKGDIFVHPASKLGARQIIEGVRGKGKDRVILYTEEAQPGVPVPVDAKADPHAIRQKPLKNFEVQRQVGGFTHWEPAPESLALAKEKEYTDIFDECQRAFAAYAEVVEVDGTKHYSDKALKLGEKIGEVSREIGMIDDAWMAAHAKNDETTTKQEAELIEGLKAAVARLPSAFLKVYPVLKQVRDEWERSNVDEDGRPIRKKTHKKGSRRGSESLPDEVVAPEGKDGQWSRPRKAATEAQMQARRPQDRQRRNEEALEFEAQGARELTDREIWQQFQKYRGARYTAERWWRDRRNTLEQRIHEIRMQQKDVTRMAILIDKLYKRREWGQAMRRLGPEVQQIALREMGDAVSRDLDLMEERKGRVLNKPVDFRKDDEELRFLYDYFFRYLAALQVGERVIAGKLSQSRGSRQRTTGETPAQPGPASVETEAEAVAAEYAVATVAAKNLLDSWHEQPERVQIEVINGLRQLVAQRDLDVAEAQTLLTQHGVPSEEQLAIIAGGLASGFNTAVSRVLASGDLPSTPEVIEGIATGLLEQQQLTRLTYDNKES